MVLQDNMNDPKYYTNDKTNSIIKNSIIRNNRDIVATIVYNELTDLLEYSRTSQATKSTDTDMLARLITRVHPQLYSNRPMKLLPYCQSCDYGCGKPTCIIDDPFILALLEENEDPWLWEDGGVLLLETQRYEDLVENPNNTNKN